MNSCPHGHELTSENTRLRYRTNRPNPYVECLACKKANRRASLLGQQARVADLERRGVSIVDQLRELADRFWSNVEKKGDGCWLWRGGSFDAKGYGQWKALGYCWRATRVAWMLENGVELPDDQDACHRCDNPPCVRPAHIFSGTNSDNVQDCIRKGRYRGNNGQHQRALTVCSNGHAYTPENTYRTKNGWRACRACHRASWRRRRERERQAQAIQP